MASEAGIPGEGSAEIKNYDSDTTEEDWAAIGAAQLRIRDGQSGRTIGISTMQRAQSQPNQPNSHHGVGEPSSRSLLAPFAPSSRNMAPPALPSHRSQDVFNRAVIMVSESESELSSLDDLSFEGYQLEQSPVQSPALEGSFERESPEAEESTEAPKKRTRIAKTANESAIEDDLAAIAVTKSRKSVSKKKEATPSTLSGFTRRGRSAITGSQPSPTTSPTKQTGRNSQAIPNINQHYDDSRNNYMKPSKRNHWSNPGTPLYDVKKVLAADECLAPDNLLRRPPPDFSYFTPDGHLIPAPEYDWSAKSRENHRKITTGHPKAAAHMKNGTNTRENQFYYNFLPKDRIMPLAGMIDRKEPIDSEVRALENMVPCLRMNEDLTGDQLQEESFHARPSVHLPIPDHIKAILVDDWENVTKNQQLVPVPSDHSVDSILNDYLAFENPKRQAGSHQADLLLEVVAGLKEYFEKCLGRILLYRFERQQYLEVREEWATSGKSALTTYGAEHFCRLLVSLPELLAQTNMDQQSCNRLCEELTKLTIWLGRNAKLYFAKEYETPGPSYIEKARAG